VNMIFLIVEFLILRVMIWYHNMIPLSSLSSLIFNTPHQLFACMECMIQLRASTIRSSQLAISTKIIYI
jgi:hypothetical protein